MVSAWRHHIRQSSISRRCALDSSTHVPQNNGIANLDAPIQIVLLLLLLLLLLRRTRRRQGHQLPPLRQRHNHLPRREAATPSAASMTALAPALHCSQLHHLCARWNVGRRPTLGRRSSDD